MSQADIPVNAMRRLLETQMTAEQRISRDDLDRRANAEHLGEDVDSAIRDLPPGDYTRAQLETRLLPAIEDRVQSRLAGLGGGPSEPSGKKGARQAKQHGRR